MTIYECLKKDHDGVKQLLNRLVSLEERHDKERHELIAQIRDELIPHARAEEAIFYNSLRSLDATKDIVVGEYKEHIEAETLLRTLQIRDKIDFAWKQHALKLKKAIEHHIHEEEEKIFLIARHVFTKEEAEMMGEAFEALKPEIREEGFLTTTMELMANLMPARFSSTMRSFNLDSRL